jgi:hypothetical protein
MSSINRSKIRRLILKEFKMMGMADMGHAGLKPMGMLSKTNPAGCDSCGMSPCGCDEYNEMGEDTLMPQHSMQPSMNHSHKGNVSREDCCDAVMCLIECCSCPITKKALMECCSDIMMGQHDS